MNEDKNIEIRVWMEGLRPTTERGGFQTLHCDRGYGEVASQRLVPLSAPLVPTRLGLRLSATRICVAALPAPWLPKCANGFSENMKGLKA